MLKDILNLISLAHMLALILTDAAIERCHHAYHR
jgi:hypothetical protein